MSVRWRVGGWENLNFICHSSLNLMSSSANWIQSLDRFELTCFFLKKIKSRLFLGTERYPCRDLTVGEKEERRLINRDTKKCWQPKKVLYISYYDLKWLSGEQRNICLAHFLHVYIFMPSFQYSLEALEYIGR